MLKIKRTPIGQDILLIVLILAICAFALMPDIALAGTGGKEWEGIWATAKDWMQGYLGRALSGVFLLVGIVFGIGRQSLITFASGIGASIGLYNSPTIIESIMTATLPYAEHMLLSTPPLIPISNGLLMM